MDRSRFFTAFRMTSLLISRLRHNLLLEAASRSVTSKRIFGSWLRSSSLKRSEAEILALNLLVFPQCLRRAGVHDPAPREHVNLVRHPERERQVLLHEQDRQPLRFQILNDAADLANQERRQPLGRLIH